MKSILTNGLQTTKPKLTRKRGMKRLRNETRFFRPIAEPFMLKQYLKVIQQLTQLDCLSITHFSVCKGGRNSPPQYWPIFEWLFAREIIEFGRSMTRLSRKKSCLQCFEFFANFPLSLALAKASILLVRARITIHRKINTFSFVCRHKLSPRIQKNPSMKINEMHGMT